VSEVALVHGAPPLDAMALRRNVFVDEQGVDPAVEADALDAAATHAVLRRDGVALATGRLLDPGGTPALGRVGRMAVARAARGQGLGALVLGTLEDAAAQAGLVGVELHAQAHAAGFYAHLGYAAQGPSYLEAGIEHLTMTRELLPGLRPVRDDDSAGIITLIGGCWAEHPGCVLDIDGEEPWMRAPASRQPGRLWVVERQGTVQASVGVKGAELVKLYVSAGARRLRLGERLVRLAERAGARELWTDTRFTDAHRLYHRLGWRDTGRTRELHDLSETTELELVR